MIKQLLTIFSVASLVTVNAQSRITKSAITAPNSTELTAHSITYKAAATTLTLNPLTGTGVTVYTAGSDTATPGCSPNAGYVFGSNCYGDPEKAQYFAASSYSSVTGASVTAVTVLFFKDGTMGTGGAATQTVGVNIYNGTSNTTAPATLLGGAVTTMSNILMVAQTSTTSYFPYTFTFATSPLLTGGFYAALTLPTTAGDTAVVANETATINNAWERWSDNVWYNVQSTWGLKANLAIFPEVTGNTITTGVGSAILNKNISIQPNPSTGMVNVKMALGKNQNISLTVTNALGQQILYNTYNNITNQSLSLDLTNQASGIYFVTVSNGTEKMVQHLIISK